MIVEAVSAVASATELDLPAWSTAEFLDAPVSDGLVLRALVCRLGAGRWQWSIISLDRGEGTLICAGIDQSTADARRTAAAEIAKCLQNAAGEPWLETA